MTTQAFKPSVSVYAKSTLAVAGLGVPVIAALFLSNDNRLLFGVLVGAAVVLTVGGVLLYIARARIYVTPDQIGRRGFFATKWMTRQSVSRSLLVLRLDAGTAAPAHLFLFAPDSTLVMRLYGALWGEPQLRSLADALEVEQSVFANPLKAAELDRLEPTALNWAEKNPGPVAGLVLGAFAVVAVVVAVILYSTR